MFTGIIKETGKIRGVSEGNECKLIEISCNQILKGLSAGDSVAVDGCCLTVKKLKPSGFICDISYSTLEKTTFKNMGAGKIVNLESSLTPSAKIGGHFVSGHVDGTAEITGIEKKGNSYRIELKIPEGLSPFLAPRGSVALDGISLTVSEADRGFFAVAIIPHTFENTSLSRVKEGDKVNIEVDLLSRYIFRILSDTGIINPVGAGNQNDDNLKEKLVEYGFIK
ncbi:MAG: Riboflavin synthase [Actinobacteria bacterium ADurb.Bin346]|nr:MAG: Riboflavin synthase [Actinobacteria bacterium ADurb.Bin346]